MQDTQTVLITGAGTGLGHATAFLLARHGYSVIGTVRPATTAAQKDRLGSLRESTSGLNLTFRELELTDAQSRKNMLHDLPPIFALINNAGVGVFAPFETCPTDHLRWQFEVNLLAPIELTQSLIPQLREQSGHLVWIGSMANYFPLPYQSFYSASKAALAALSDSLRLELQSQGIRVSCIEPGDFKTEFPSNRRTVDGGSLYPELSDARKLAEKREQDGPPPQMVAQAVLKVLQSDSPPPRVPVGPTSYWEHLLAGWMPHRLRLKIIDRLFVPDNV